MQFSQVLVTALMAYSATAFGHHDHDVKFPKFTKTKGVMPTGANTFATHTMVPTGMPFEKRAKSKTTKAKTTKTKGSKAKTTKTKSSKGSKSTGSTSSGDTGSSSGNTTTGGSTGGSTGENSASFPTAVGSVVVLSAPQAVSGSFDGGLKEYDRGQPCNSDADTGSENAVFILDSGATLSNVIIGADQLEGVHCKGPCTLKNVWFRDVCEGKLFQHVTAKTY